MSKKEVLIMFGGNAPEHEVSVITGLQVFQKIDKEKYCIHAIWQDKNGDFYYLKNMSNMKDFLTVKKKSISWGKDSKGGYLRSGLKKIYPYAAFLAYHGGYGECGSVQGMLDVLDIPYTSPSVEGSVISSNKGLAKDIVKNNGVPVLDYVSVFSKDIRNDVENVSSDLLKKLHLPVIVKPSHLGSSIGIEIAKEKEDLVRILSGCSLIDTEVVVEPCLQDFTEYNCSVMYIDGNVCTSAIEKPLRHAEILTFANKYQDANASKGGGKIGGMANLSRELPAKIDVKKQTEIENMAKEVYILCRTKGLVRIDFIEDSKGNIYFNELNRIPGSMAFYLWETSGISFTEMITSLIEESVSDWKKTSKMNMDYSTDIIEKFINNTNH